jgi:hypothetical protein
MLTSRLDVELVQALDREAARLRDTTGLPCSRTAALALVLRRTLLTPEPGANPEDIRFSARDESHSVPENKGIVGTLDPSTTAPKPAKPKVTKSASKAGLQKGTPAALDDAALRRLCKRTKLPQRALSEKTGVAQSTLNVFLKGGTLSPESREKVVSALGG